MIFTIAWKNLLHKPLNALLCWLLITMGVGIISMLLVLQNRFEKQFSDNIDGVDMVLGAKGSPLQLILSSVFQMDAPNGNIPLREAEKWMKHPLVEQAIPLAYGDSYQGFRILGTTRQFLEKYQAEPDKGRIFQKDFEVVAGSEAANRLQLKPGDRFFSTHGDHASGEVHAGQAYTITGILKPTGMVVDRLLVGNIESVWKIHDHGEEEEQHEAHEEAGDHTEDHHAHANHHDHEEAEHEKEITAVLIKFRNPMGLVQLPRTINQQTNMMAAIPAIEVNRLFTLMGVGVEVLKNIGLVIVLMAALSVFVALLNAMRERRHELALMRSLGAGRMTLFGLLLLEGTVLTVGGLVSGLLAGRLVLALFSGAIENEYHLEMNALFSLYAGEWSLIGTVLLSGLLAALIPAVKAWRVNISKTLSDA